VETLDLRPATLADRPSLLALAASDDDLARALDAWLADPAGVAMGAFAGGSLVGMAHVQMVSDDEAWLDGIRADEDWAEKGTVALVIRRCQHWARERGARVARCAIPSGDTAITQAIDSGGFAQIGAYVPFEAPTAGATPDLLPGPVIGQPGPDALERLWGWLERSNVAPLTGGLLLPAGIGMALTDARLADLLATQAMWTVEEWGEIQALAIAGAQHPPGGSEIFSTAYLDGASESVGRLMLFLRSLAAERGFDLIDARPPDLLILHDALNGAGFARQSEGIVTLWAAEV
jgi:hypothetical protein